MPKGKIITSTDNEHGFVENENGKEIPFVQPLCKELGLRVGSVVRFDVYTDPVTKDKTAYNVELYKKGIITGKDNDTGMIADANFGSIPTIVPLMKSRGIQYGDLVKYEHLQTSNGLVAVYVDTTTDPDQADSTK